MNRTRVFIADDHAGYREGLARLIADHPAVDLVGHAADGADALRAIADLRPDVALLDVRMPGIDGLEVCRRLRAGAFAPGTRVVLITGAPDRALTTRATEAGASALLGKETPPRDIAAQLLAAAAGRVGSAVE